MNKASSLPKQTEVDWEKEAGLKPEPKTKLLDHYGKYIPSMNDIMIGSIFLVLGATGLSGGRIGIQIAEEAAPAWVSLGSAPKWICSLVIWLGLDSIVFKGRVTPWFLKKYINPIVEVIVKNLLGEGRYRRWKEKQELKEKRNASS